MKKYLMTGIAAVAMCAAFTSCSHDVDPVSQEDLNKIEAQKIVEGYKTAFVQVFGQPAADQDWGFGTVRTRAHDDGRIDVNGNEWKSKPGVTAAEARAVFDYVNRVKTTIPHYSETAPTGLSTYYCTQVWGGNNKVESGVSDERTYPNYDQKQRGEAGNVYGPEKMNELAIAMSTNKGAIGIDDNGALVGDWCHINNFNASENTNWGGNTGVIGGGTLDFAYKSSEDSKYHNKWIIIDGQYITDADGVNHAGKYYVCFDFISCKDGVYTNFQKPGTGNVEVPGAYATVAEAIAAKAKDRNGNLVQSNWSIGNVTGGNMCIPANDIYTDWIIRLVNAAPTNEDPNYTIRVIGEDLTYNAANPNEADFDFNDVVFDVALNIPGKTYIKLKAAGGTLPLIIGIDEPDNNLDYTANEVHNIFGNYSINTMINTHASAYGASADGVPDAILVLNTEYEDAKDIPVFVKKSGVWCELTAVRGEPASKIGVPINFGWCYERVSMKGEYPLFVDWVTADANQRNFIWW